MAEGSNANSLDARGKALIKEAQGEAARLHSAEAAHACKARYLGKKGLLQDVMKQLSAMPPEERKAVGKVVNEIKEALEQIFAGALSRLDKEALDRSLSASSVDVTRPARERWLGTLHPLTRTTFRIIEVFQSLGFVIADGPEIEHDFYNFEALNFPKDHPARDMQDTFFVSPDVLLRTHTSPVQIRTMLEKKPPVRIICPGKVYRTDADITHSPMFHQVEGLWVDQRVSMADLKGVLRAFAEKLFGPQTKVRLRPSYFPFVEPGAEVDVTCVLCAGKGCRVCKHSGWLEILGAGMVHPNVLGSAGYNPEEVRGFAFGMGVERIAMLVHGIDDIRLFFDNDIRFLRQFQ
jgi:phenylalanyl-tRNA synthetase alpha chain